MKMPSVDFHMSWIFGGVLACSAGATAMDPYYPPAESEAYHRRITEGREHESEREPRPAPGTSPLVALQTIIIPEFTIEKTGVASAFSDFTRECAKLKVHLPFYLDAGLARWNGSITCSARNETGQKVLSMLLRQSGAALRINGSDLMVGHPGTWGLNPYATGLKTWILSQDLHLRLFSNNPDKADTAASDWINADQVLKKQGVSFPPGTYADYRPDVHALVVINRFVTLDSLNEWIHEAESEFVINAAKASGRIQMKDYELILKSFPLTRQQTQSLRNSLVSHGKLVPFASSSQSIFHLYGIRRPEGSAIWLDEKNAKLWVLNTAEEFASYGNSLGMLIEPPKKDGL